MGFYIVDKIEPFHQPFSLQNLSLRYPHAVHETIPMPLALFLSGIIPLVSIAVYTLLIDGLFSHNKPQKPLTGKRKRSGPHRWRDRLWEFNCGFLGLLLAQGLAFVLTQVLKNACGKPRPDIIDRCQPRETQDPYPFGLSNSTICTGDPALIKDGFRSWPSGHSSSAFAGLFYLSVWLCGKLHVMDNRGEVWKTLLVMVPVLGALLIAVSRIMDARHHPFDVITGGLLGIICAYISYRQYFPPVTEAWNKGRAYPIRSWGSEPVNPFDDAHRSPVPLPPTAPAGGESTMNLRNPEEERLDVPGGGPAREPSPSIYGAPNPYTSNFYHRRLHDRDGDSSSGSEDVADGYGYEMQQGYLRTQNPGLSGVGPGPSPLPRYETDTAYHPPVVPGVSALHAPPGAVTTEHERHL